jgi:hypothetical protein
MVMNRFHKTSFESISAGQLRLLRHEAHLDAFALDAAVAKLLLSLAGGPSTAT